VRTAGIEPAWQSRGIFLPATAFAAALRRLWSGLYLHHRFRFRCCPSSLYTFLSRGLARDRHLTGFPDFEQFYSQRFRRCTQIAFKSLVSTNSTTSALASLLTKRSHNHNRESRGWSGFYVWIIGRSSAFGRFQTLNEINDCVYDAYSALTHRPMCTH